MVGRLHDEGMAPVGSADRFDAFRALAGRRGRPGTRLIETLTEARAGTADSPEAWAPALAAQVGLPAAAALGPASYYADLATAHGRRHLRVCSATACFAAQNGRHLTDTERELGIMAGTASPDGATSLQAVRCLGYCYAGPSLLGAPTCRLDTALLVPHGLGAGGLRKQGDRRGELA